MIDRTKSQDLTLWQSHIILLLARRGFTKEEALSIAPDFEETSKKIMRSLGISWEDIESTYPQKSLNRLLNLMKKDPEEFDELIDKSAKVLISRN
jgi:DNA-directed RNA polymerase specialized sigma subunit